MAIVILAALLASGCSFVLVSGPPANHRQLPVVECTTNRIGPALDTVWTVLQVLNFAVAASRSEEEWNESFNGEPPFDRKTAIPVYAGLALVGAAGMYYGFSRTGACRRAKRELMMRTMNGPQPGPGTWPPPGPGTWPPPAPVGPQPVPVGPPPAPVGPPPAPVGPSPAPHGPPPASVGPAPAPNPASTPASSPAPNPPSG
jgi:hypothetical protein